MKKKREDRRVGRTRQLLHEALMGLILEKGYEAITVQDILDRANLGRSTFYSHYRDKDALLLTGFDHLQAMLEERHQSVMSGKMGGKRDFNLSLELFRHALENQRMYKAMVGKQSGQMIMKTAHKYLSDLVEKYFDSIVKTAKKTAVPVDVAVHWIVSSFLSLLTWWLDNSTPFSPEEMDRIFRKLTLPGLEAGLGIKLP